MATMTEESLSWLNRLLRGELSAVETYEQAVSRCEGAACAGDLRHILEQHREATECLREHVERRKEQPSTSSGTWGAFAQLVTGAATLLGPTTTLQALQQGEEHGVAEYESALADEALDPESRELILRTLLPRCRAHVQRLAALVAG
jgi:hypothetical protein